MIGAAGVAIADRRDAKVRERRNPLLEDGTDRVVLLRVDAAHLARAVIEVVVSVKRLPLLRRL